MMTDEEFEEERERRGVTTDFTDEEFEEECDRRAAATHEAEDARATVILHKIEEAERQQEYQDHLTAPGHLVAKCVYCVDNLPSHQYYFDMKLPADWATDNRDQQIARVMQVWTARRRPTTPDQPEIKIARTAVSMTHNISFTTAIGRVLDALDAQAARWSDNPPEEEDLLDYLSRMDTDEARRALGFDGGPVIEIPEPTYTQAGGNLEVGGEQRVEHARMLAARDKREQEAKRLCRAAESYIKHAGVNERTGTGSGSSLITVTESLLGLLKIAMARIDDLER